MKIAVYGHSGAGKSTFAKFLSEYYNIPVLYLDTVQFLPNWEKRPLADALKIVRKFTDENDAWVIDGNYRYDREQRMREADRIFFLDLPRGVCLKSAWNRYKTNRGRRRFSMADGCNETFDLAFFWWIVAEGRFPKRMKRYREIIKQYPEKAVVFRSRKEIDEYKERLKNETVGK